MLRSLRLFDSEVVVRNFNDDFLLLIPMDKSVTGKIGKAIFQNKFDFVEEVIVSETEICIKLNDLFDDSKVNLLDHLAQEENLASVTYRIPVYFNAHEDWKNVESHSGLNKKEIISKLAASTFQMTMFGFLPGFVYLDGLESALQVPRKKIPTKYVQANSIAIGGKYLGLYALDSPGGWHVVGQTPIKMLQISKLPPVVLNPGDQIKLRSIDEKEYKELLQSKTSLKEYNARV